MIVEIFLGKPAETIQIEASAEAVAACYKLPRDADRIAYWAGVSQDRRFYDERGNLKSCSMIWATKSEKPPTP